MNRREVRRGGPRVRRRAGAVLAGEDAGAQRRPRQHADARGRPRPAAPRARCRAAAASTPSASTPAAPGPARRCCQRHRPPGLPAGEVRDAGVAGAAGGDGVVDAPTASPRARCRRSRRAPATGRRGRCRAGPASRRASRAAPGGRCRRPARRYAGRCPPWWRARPPRGRRPRPAGRRSPAPTRRRRSPRRCRAACRRPRGTPCSWSAASCSSVSRPQVIVPSASRLTLRPDRPEPALLHGRRTYRRHPPARWPRRTPVARVATHATGCEPRLLGRRQRQGQPRAGAGGRPAAATARRGPPRPTGRTPPPCSPGSRRRPSASTSGRRSSRSRRGRRR